MNILVLGSGFLGSALASRCPGAMHTSRDPASRPSDRRWLGFDANNQATWTSLDGLTVDNEGNVWSAMWDGSCVVCYRPDGTVKTKVDLPTKKITSVMFGGPEMSDLYITSAGNDETSTDANQAGNLFHITPGPQGRREFPSRIALDTK